jgi:hypothetical protein
MSYRFEKFDGTLSLPYKLNGKYHLAGKIVVCPIATLRKTLENTVNLLAWKKATCIVFPPLPRYLFSGCRLQKDPCTNVGTANHERHLLIEIIGLRNALKRFVAGLGTGRCRVLDCCCVTDCTTTANIDTRNDVLRNMTASDGIHYQISGYCNLVKNILVSKMAAKQVAIGTQSTKMHFWRGFRSPVGSNTTVPTGTFSLLVAGRLPKGKIHRGRWSGSATLLLSSLQEKLSAFLFFSFSFFLFLVIPNFSDFVHCSAGIAIILKKKNYSLREERHI